MCVWSLGLSEKTPLTFAVLLLRESKWCYGFPTGCCESCFLSVVCSACGLFCSLLFWGHKSEAKPITWVDLTFSKNTWTKTCCKHLCFCDELLPNLFTLLISAIYPTWGMVIAQKILKSTRRRGVGEEWRSQRSTLNSHKQDWKTTHKQTN